MGSRYGPRGEPDRGAILIDEPKEIFDHRYTSVIEMDDGGWTLTSRCGPSRESPSDLTVSMTVDFDGAVTIDVLRMH